MEEVELMQFTNVQFEQMENIGVISLAHPPANALSQATFTGIVEALDYVEKEKSIKVVIIRGEGKFFAAGADIKEFTSVETKEQAAQLAKNGQDICRRIELFPKPVIATIHGAALGGGLELAMSCHIRFATPDAKLGLPELNLGILPGFAGTQRLPKIIGKAKALEIMFSGLPISGEEAKALGLVNQCYAQEEILDKALTFAKLAASKGALSLQYTLQAVAYGEDHGVEEGSQKEAELFGQIFQSHDAKEGIQAFIEKRKPNFKDC